MVCIVGFGLVGLFEHIIWILLGSDVMGLLQLILKRRIADIFVTSHTKDGVPACRDQACSSRYYCYLTHQTLCNLHIQCILEAHFH